MHSGGIERRLVEEFESVREAEIGILDAQRGRWNDREVLGDDYRCSLGAPGRGGILGVGDEGKLSGSGLLDAVEPGDLGIGRAVFQARVKGGCDLRKFHGG